MKVKKGDFVLNWCSGEFMVDIGRALEDENEDGEFDMQFMHGGTVSPAGDESAVIPEWVARFLYGAIENLPYNKKDECHRVPKKILDQIVIGGELK